MLRIHDILVAASTSPRCPKVYSSHTTDVFAWQLFDCQQRFTTGPKHCSGESDPFPLASEPFQIKFCNIFVSGSDLVWGTIFSPVLNIFWDTFEWYKMYASKPFLTSEQFYCSKIGLDSIVNMHNFNSKTTLYSNTVSYYNAIHCIKRVTKWTIFP